MKKILLAISFSGIALVSMAQYKSKLKAAEWVDSVYLSLSDTEKIAQLIIIRAHSNLGADHVAQVKNLITKYNVGALCFFQGGPVRQANLTNLYQSIAKTPLLVTIDGEYGLGMRLDSIKKFPYQSTLGALTDTAIVYQMGCAVGRQMKRMGVHINYAPSVDINNNPANPVIGFRSFGEDKYKVASFGIAYMRGMQDEGIMACAKHFPGHGDTETDSHLDLPVINKSMGRLDTLELYPFKEMIKAGVGSVMNAHLYIPAIDKTPNRPTSLSKNAVTDLLQKKLNFKGLCITDGMEMKGITKFFPAGEAAVQALLAGNDMLCLPENVDAAIAAVKKALEQKKMSKQDLEEKVKKALLVKYKLGLYEQQWINTANLTEDLNQEVDEMRTLVARNTVTLVRDNAELLPLNQDKKIAFVGLGLTAPNIFSRRMQQDHDADVYLFSYKDGDDKANYILKQLKEKKYDIIIAGVHNYSLRPANKFGISSDALQLWNSLPQTKTATLLFGNVYAAANFCNAPTLAAFYQDDSITYNAAADFMADELPAKGKLPVSVCNFSYGTGLSRLNYYPVPTSAAWIKIDSIVSNAMLGGAFPGAVVLVAQNGAIKYHKAFGNFRYDVSQPVSLETLFDVASVTKICATTIAVMKLYEQGKLALNKKIGDYLSWTKGTNKANLHIGDLLLHQAGLVPYISFYKETLDSAGHPRDSIYSTVSKEGYRVPVAKNLFLRNDWEDTLLKRILESPLSVPNKYVYSDNDFIFLGKIVEAISGVSLDEYVSQNFYQPLGMASTGFKPIDRFNTNQIAPTEEEKNFRGQLLQGYVHDEGASMFGGVAGHAGLFSDAYDLAKLCQMLLNGGEYNGIRFLNPETIRLFTSYHGKNNSRRGYGFDKPEKDNNTRPNPYPCASVSPETFGHTGFTGTCVWIDPKNKMVFILLTNRVYPTRENNKLSAWDIRYKVQEAAYEAVRKDNLLSHGL